MTKELQRNVSRRESVETAAVKAKEAFERPRDEAARGCLTHSLAVEKEALQHRDKAKSAFVKR